MSDTVSSFAITQGGNNKSNFLFPELLPPSQTTDNLRSLQAAIRKQWNQAEWFQFGNGNLTATVNFVSGTQFTVINTLAAVDYHVGRRVRGRGSITGTITGSITAVNQTGGNTNVTVNWDTGSLSNEDFIIELGILSAVDSSVPRGTVVGQAFSGDNAFAGDVSVGGALTVTGNITGANATFNTVNFTTGPFNFLGSARRFPGQGIANAPAGTKETLIELWGAGGGGSSEGASIRGTNGGTAVLVSTPPGRSLTLPGGLRGGASPINQGQNQATATGLVQAGVFKGVGDMPGLGGPGGVGAEGGVSGNPGHYVKAIVTATTAQVSGWTLTGGGAGSGGVEVGEANGGNGSRAAMFLQFYG